MALPSRGHFYTVNISIELPNDVDGLGLHGVQPVHVHCSPRPLRVELYVDEKLYDIPIYNVDLAVWQVDTTKLLDATHMFRAEGVYKSRRSRTQIAVTVRNQGVLVGRAYGSREYGSETYGGVL